MARLCQPHTHILRGKAICRVRMRHDKNKGEGIPLPGLGMGTKNTPNKRALYSNSGGGVDDSKDGRIQEFYAGRSVGSVYYIFILILYTVVIFNRNFLKIKFRSLIHVLSPLV